MKKFVTLLLAFVSFGVFNSTAQSFSVEYDTVTASVGGTQHLINRVNNLTTSDLTITWSVVATDFPADWKANAGICDNTLCISGTPLFSGTSYTPVYPPGLGTFYLLLDLTTATTNGTYYLRVGLSGATTSKTQTYIVTRTPVSVSVVNADKGVAVYPNPAKNELKVVADETDDIKKIILHNLTGKEILTYDMGNSIQANINVEMLPTGLYFIKCLNSNSEIVSRNKFIKE